MDIKKIIKKSFNSIGYELANLRAFEKNGREKNELKNTLERLVFIIKHNNNNNEEDAIRKLINVSCDNLLKSKSQLFQELFVLFCLDEKRNGFFIEFGATDGITLSNTYLLERDFAWDGILVEPARVWLPQLKKNRKCRIDNRCVWSQSGGQITFHETDIAELSTISNYSGADFFSEKRKNKKAYEVETISLKDLLDFYKSPKEIDFLSIDTEGSEFDILNAFDFTAYQVKIITVEHNFSPKREDIFKLLSGNGFRRVFESISFFDDWYVNNVIYNKIYPGKLINPEA